jgi:translation elongation factor EF-1alpha
VIKLLDAVKEKRERGQIISISATISVRNEDILLILTKMEKVRKKKDKLVEIWSSVAFLIKAVEITN